MSLVGGDFLGLYPKGELYSRLFQVDNTVIVTVSRLLFVKTVENQV